MSYEELVKSCIKGDRKSQNTLYRTYASSMGRVCLRYLNDEEEAKDALIEGFLKVFNNLQKIEYRDKESLTVWIRRIMINECLMRLRKNKGVIFLSINEDDSISNTLIEEDISTEEIFNIIKSLPDGYRTVFNLYVVEGYSHQEIAEMLGISESASRSQLSHARVKLKEQLSKKGWK